MKLLTMALVLFSFMFVDINYSHASSVYTNASRYEGMSEIKHRRQLKSVLGVDPRRTPWCGYLVTAAVSKAGRSPPRGSGLARSWTSYGKKVSVSKAKKGDIVVIRTRRGYHVGIFVSLTGNKVVLLGGNQSNRVQKSTYNRRSIISVRR